MKRQLSGFDETPIVSGSFIEAMWETLIALGIAAAVCIGVVSLSAHLNATQRLRGIAEYSTEATGASKNDQQRLASLRVASFSGLPRTRGEHDA
jgi:hypothetical protein